MPAVLEIILRGRDEMSGPLGKAQVSLGSMVKTGAAAALGFGGMEGAMLGAKEVIVNSIGAAAAYEAQMAQIRALTGATSEDTDLLKGSIREMQKSLPKSSKELGAGAYFILSSGITDASDAADVLEIAAKASTVGLGETAVVADALTTVLNAYQMEAGQAGRVTDVLMQAVKDGKAEADAFSGVLGRVVPIAAQMGISFEEVAANMATFTRLGVSAEEAATGLRGVMTQLLKPTEEAKALLAGVGLSMQEVRDQVREKGLLSVLDMLMTKFKGNEEAISTLFPDVRGLTNVLATAGVQGEAYTEILGNMDTATGNLDRGFEEVSKTTQFKMKMAMNDLNVQLEELGALTLPLVASAATTASDAIAAFAAVARAARGDFSGFNADVRHFGDELLNLGLKMTMLGGPARTGKDAIMELASGDVRGAIRQLDDEFGVLGGVAKSVLGGGGDVELSLEASKKNIALWAKSTSDSWDQSAHVAVEGLGDVGDELGKTSELFKDFTDGIQEGLSDVLPAVDESFGEWQQRLFDLGQDYSAMEGNLQTIMDALVDQHVRGVDDIMLVVRTQGPEFAADFAQWFRDEPIAAAETLQQVMPAIMREAATEAISNVVAATSKFNEEWQKNVINVLNALPEEKRISIMADVDPELWEVMAWANRWGLSPDLIGSISAAPGFQHGGFVPPGVVMPAILHGGSRGEAVIPLDRVSRAGGGGGPVTIQVNSRFPPDRRLLRAEVMSLIPEIERALRLR